MGLNETGGMTDLSGTEDFVLKICLNFEVCPNNFDRFINAEEIHSTYSLHIQYKNGYKIQFSKSAKLVCSDNEISQNIFLISKAIKYNSE